MMPALMLIMNLVAILIVWVGADRINTGTMQVGDIMAFINIPCRLLCPFNDHDFYNPSESGHICRPVNEVLKEEPTIRDPVEEETIDLTKRTFEFRNVSLVIPMPKKMYCQTSALLQSR